MGAVGESVNSGGRPSQLQQMDRRRRDSSVVMLAARDAYNRVRVIHYLDVFFFGAGFLLCTVTAYLLSKANFMASSNQCILNATWKLSFYNDTSMGKFYSIDSDSSGWGSERMCNFVQFGNVGCAIGGFILCWFFLLLKPYADAYNNRTGTSAAKLVPWVMLVSMAFTSVALMASIDMNIGYNEWCNKIVEQNPSHIHTCSDLGGYKLGSIATASRAINIYAMMLAAQICSWCGFSCWLLAFLLVFVRFAFHMDFPSFFFDYEAIPETTRTHSRKHSSGPRNLPVVFEVPTKSSLS